MSSLTRTGWRHGWRRPTSKTLFLAVLLVVLALYTQMALDLEWTTVAGRIGPGYFPRIVGVLGLVLTLVSLVRSLRATDHTEALDGEEEAGAADLGHHPGILVVTVLAGALLVVFLEPLGAIVSGAVFLAAMLWLMNRGRTLTNALLSVGVPLGLYLVFQTALNAGLPPGILPAF